MEKKKVLITTLGMVGKNKDGEFKPAIYGFDKSILDTDETLKYVNVFPLFINLFEKDFDIIPLYTDDSLKRQQEVLDFYKLDFDIKENGIKINENEPNEIFSAMNRILVDDKYSNILIDVTHGFRSIPILTTINMVIANFQNNNKIENIIYAQENSNAKKHERDYILKDLRIYLDISNISFILSTFAKNYTVAGHVDSKRYSHLIEALNSFSNDLMALSLNNLFKSSAKNLIKELEKVEDTSVKNQAKELKAHIEQLTQYKDKKRYQTYYDIAKDLFDKDYMLLSLSLLYESIRMYIKTSIKKNEPQLVEKVEKEFKGNLYKIGDFFKNLKWKDYDKYQNEKNKINITKSEYDKLKNNFPSNLAELYDNIDNKRNNLAHANADKRKFKDIKQDIQNLFDEYYNKCIKEKSASDLANAFKNR